MAIKNILLPEYNFVYTYYFGSVNDTQVLAYADQLKNQLSEFRSYCEIIDFSHNVDFSGLSSETLNRAGYLEKDRPHPNSGPLAILVTDPLTYGLARTYSTFAKETRSGVLIAYKLKECIDFMNYTNPQRVHIENVITQNLTASCDIYAGTQLEFNFPLDR